MAMYFKNFPGDKDMPPPPPVRPPSTPKPYHSLLVPGSTISQFYQGMQKFHASPLEYAHTYLRWLIENEIKYVNEAKLQIKRYVNRLSGDIAFYHHEVSTSLALGDFDEDEERKNIIAQVLNRVLQVQKRLHRKMEMQTLLSVLQGLLKRIETKAM